MANITLNVKEYTDKSVEFTLPVYKKFELESQVEQIEKFRIGGKLLKKPQFSDRNFETTIYMEIDSDGCTIITKKVNKETKTLIYDVERGDYPGDDNVLYKVLSIEENDITADDFNVVKNAAIDMINGGDISSEFVESE